MEKKGWSYKTKELRKGGATPSQEEKVGKVMHEFKEGKLHIGKSKKIVKKPKQAIAIALSEAGLSKKMATGGTIKYYNEDESYRLTPSNSIEKELLDRINYEYIRPYFVGNFGWKTPQGKLADGYLYNLDDYDQNLIGKLKEGEKVYRYINRTTAIGGMSPFIKINANKGLLYFLVPNDNDDIIFETKGTKAQWINLIESKMAKGGGVEDLTSLKKEILSLQSKAFKTFSGSPKQKKIIEEISKLQKIVEDKGAEWTVENKGIYLKKDGELYAEGGGIEISSSDKLSRLGIKTTNEFGNRYRDFLDRLEDSEDGEYVGYKLDLSKNELILIQKKGFKVISILDYSEFPRKGTWEINKESAIHYSEGGGVDINDWDLPVIRSQFEEEEFEYRDGGNIYSRTMKTANGTISGKVEYNDFWKTYQVIIDGVVYEEFKTKEEAIQNLKNAGFDKMLKGGNLYAKEDKEMLHSQTNQIKHHASEMESVIDKQKHIEPWVVSKMGRATSDLSDVTHYLDGRTKMALGGNVDGNFYILLDDGSKKWYKEVNSYEIPNVYFAAGYQDEKDKGVALVHYDNALRTLYKSNGEFADKMVEYAGKEGREIDKMALGGGIPNNYYGKTAEEVWNKWSEAQKLHFLHDHNVTGKAITDYKDLSADVKMALIEHVTTGQYALGGTIGFIPMDLEEDLAITAKWGGTDIKGVIGILNAMIDSGFTDEDLKPKPTKTGHAHQKAIENKTKEIWAKIEPKYKGDFKGNMYYGTISRLVQRANSGDNILKRFKPFRKNQNFATGGNIESQISEIKAKIEKAKANKVMPEALKKQYIEKYEKELAALEPKKDDKDFSETLMGLESDVMDSLNISSGGEIKENESIQKKYIAALDKKINANMFKGVDTKDLRDKLEDENYHTLNNYLGLKGYYGESGKNDYKSYYDRSIAKGYKSFLNPALFEKESKSKAPKKESIEKLSVNPNYKYQNSVNKWLEYNKPDSLKYKVAVKLLKGENDSDEVYNLGDKQYDNILRSLEKIGEESKHEMAWRTQNYSTAEAEKWVMDALNKYFTIGKTTKKESKGIEPKFKVGDFVEVTYGEELGKKGNITKVFSYKDYPKSMKVDDVPYYEIENTSKNIPESNLKLSESKTSKKYDYIPQRDIEQIKAKQGTIENKDILDGAYVKKGWKHKR